MPDRPNVVLITSHDLGRHLGCYGIDAVDTPNLDGLAVDGIRFANAYATSPKCSPSRGSMLTGRYPQSNGLMGLVHSPWNWRLNDGERTIPELLGDVGYETHLAGLQHVAPDAARLDFDHRHAAGRDAAATAAAASEVLDGDADRPIYAQFGFHEVHRPLECDPHDEDGVFVPDYLEGTAEQRADLARFQGEVNYLDERVGEVLTALEDAEVRDETVIVFATEHGIPYPGAKGTLRSAGVGIAMLMDGPGPAFDRKRPVEAVFSNVDVLPTVFDAIDVPIPAPVEGVSFLPYLAGEDADPPRDAAFTQYHTPTRGIITDRYNLIRHFSSGRTPQYPTAAPPTGSASTNEDLPYAQLFDLDADPFELADIGPDAPDVVTDLSTRVRTWMADIDDPLLQGPIRKPYHQRAMHDLLTRDQSSQESRPFFEQR